MSFRPPSLPLRLVFACLVVSACKQGAEQTGSKARAASDAGTYHVRYVPMEGVRWQTPPDWRPESFTLPTPYAQDLPRGVAEVRWAPTAEVPGDMGYQAEAMAWLFPESVATDAPALEQMLTSYFKGSCKRLAEGRLALSDAHFHADLVRVSEPLTDRNETGDNYRGSFSTYDCAGTGSELTLHLRVHVADCTEGQRRAVVVLASPKHEGLIWRDLEQRYHELSCH